MRGSNLGYESAVVNGQMINVAPGQAFDPLTFGQAYNPASMWPRQGAYMVPPVLPAGALQGAMAPSAYGATVPTPASETGNFFHGTKSPLWWGLGFLIVGVLMLMHIHYH